MLFQCILLCVCEILYSIMYLKQGVEGNHYILNMVDNLNGSSSSTNESHISLETLSNSKHYISTFTSQVQPNQFKLWCYRMGYASIKCLENISYIYSDLKLSNFESCIFVTYQKQHITHFFKKYSHRW